jgi:hypothetical protein
MERVVSPALLATLCLTMAVAFTELAIRLVIDDGICIRTHSRMI